jgi:hypothetical protein
VPIPGTFDDPKKHPPHSSVYPVITNIAWVPSSNSAIITWTTDVASSSQVAYGSNQNKDQRSPYDPTPVTSHSVVLTGLTNGVVYFFNVQSFFFDSLSISVQNAFITTGGLILMDDGTFILQEDATKILTET